MNLERNKVNKKEVLVWQGKPWRGVALYGSGMQVPRYLPMDAIKGTVFVYLYGI